MSAGGKGGALRYGSVCSGIEAATAAWHPLGWEPAFFSEIEKHPSSVLKRHYPHVPNHGDMTKFKEWPDHAIDLLVGGTPCQSFSVAGLRKGLADPRGNLALVYLAIADRYRPKWLLWENVPGVLSSNGGRDFGAFLGGMAELGYGWAYAVRDAQFVRVESHLRAVPQRRRRVFVVGHLGDWRRAAAVLFEREGLQGHPPPRREAGKGTSRGFEVGPGGGGFTDLSPTMDARAKDGPIRNQLGLGVMHPAIQSNSGDVGYCLTASAQQSLDAETETLLAVAHALRGEGHDASEDGTGRGTPIIAIQGAATRENPSSGPDGIGVRQDGAAYTLEARNEVQAVAFSCKDYGGDAGEVSPTLRSMSHHGSHANAGGQVAIAYRTAGDGAVFEEGEKTAPLTTNTDPNTHVLAVAFDLRGREGGSQFEGPHDTANIRAASGGSSKSYIAQTYAVRRLTPEECEKLQGFPPGYTALDHTGKQIADGPRYKMLGNSMACNVMRHIGERIAEVEAMTGNTGGRND